MSLNFIIAWNNKKWYNKRDLNWRFTLVFMKSYADKSIVIAEIKWQSNTGQSVLKSKGLYWTGGHFIGLVRRSDGNSFSLLDKNSSFHPDPLTNMITTGNSCFWMANFLKSSPKSLGQMNRNLVGSIYGRSYIKIAHFIPIRLQTWPPQEILLSDWFISKKNLLHCGKLLKGR